MTWNRTQKCRKLRQVNAVKEAAKAGVFLWIQMKDSIGAGSSVQRFGPRHCGPPESCATSGS